MDTELTHLDRNLTNNIFEQSSEIWYWPNFFSTIQNFSVIADSRKTTLFPPPAVQLCCQASNFLASPSCPLPLTSARKHQLSAAFRERHSKSKNHTFHGLTFFSSFCCCSSSIINVTRDDNCCDRRSRKCFPCCLIFSDNNVKT